MKPKTPRQPYGIVVTGTPGAGKTAISKALARQAHANYLSLTRLVVNERLHLAVDKKRRTRVVDLNRTRAWLRRSLHESQAVTIIDTHIPDAVPRECVKKVIVIRCHPTVLERRLRKKGWGTAKVRENVLAEILDSCYVIARTYYGADKVVELDNSGAGVSRAVNKCKALLKKKSTHGIDWIADLDSRVLERYIQ
jgi:adenylate kinase